MNIQKTLSKAQILIMAVTAGVCVANVYYTQPILKDIAISLHTDISITGYLSVLSQVGYGLGLFFIIPLGDKIERKKLILWLQGFLMIALLGFAFATSLWMLCIASLTIGLFAVSAQVLLPMAAALVTENRGKIVGIIFTGILVGVLLARVFSGFIAEWLNWRWVFIISAGMVFITGVLLQADFPSTPERFTGNYSELLKSTFQQFKRFVLLRKVSLIGALSFGTLSSFWITLTFFLSEPPFSYDTDHIGMFGFLAAGGALLAPTIGKLSDKGHSPKKSLAITLSFILISVLGMLLFPDSVPVLLLAVVLIDVGVQGTQVTNIALIYTLDEKAHSRINTVYMTSYFVGGSIGAYLGIRCWKWGGHHYVMLQMLLFVICAFMVVSSINKNLLSKRVKNK